MPNVYFHCGQMGDIAYSLPTVRALGPGKFITCLRKERHDLLEPLLRLQPYITDVAHDPHGRMFDWNRVPVEVTHDLNSFRKREFKLEGHTLVRVHGIPFGCNPATMPWLTPAHDWKKGAHQRALIARSFRYHNPSVNWPALAKHLRLKHDRIAFVGLEAEWREFQKIVPGIDWLPTANLADLARAIYESHYFAGNQSMPLALAIGLGVEHAVEVCTEAPNCSFPEMSYQKRLG